MLRTACTLGACIPVSMRDSVLVEKSRAGAAISRLRPASSRISRNRPPSTRLRITEPLRTPRVPSVAM